MIESLTQSRISTVAAVSLFLVLIFSVFQFFTVSKEQCRGSDFSPSMCWLFPLSLPGGSHFTIHSNPCTGKHTQTERWGESQMFPSCLCAIHANLSLPSKCGSSLRALLSFWGILCNPVYIHLCPRRSEGSDVVLGASGKNYHPAPEPGLAGCKTQDRMRSDGHPYLLSALLCLYYSVLRCSLFYSVFF